MYIYIISTLQCGGHVRKIEKLMILPTYILYQYTSINPREKYDSTDSINISKKILVTVIAPNVKRAQK